MSGQDSLHGIFKELRAHAESSGDDALLDLVSEMEGKLAEGGASISVGNISNSTAVAIGNGIDIAIHQSNVPEALVARLTALVNAMDKSAAQTLPARPRPGAPVLRRPATTRCRHGRVRKGWGHG